MMMSKSKVRWVIGFVSLSLMWSCGKGKATDGTPDRAEAVIGENSGAKSPAGDAQGQAESDKSKSASPAAPAYSISELIAKLTWNADIANNASLKVYSGFDGTNPFKILVDVGVYGELPSTITLSEEQEIELYDSPEYQKAAAVEAAKISFTADSTLVSVKISEEYNEGKVYELTTLKAGSGAAKATIGTKELSLAIQVTAYTAAQVTAGKQRYETAVAGATPSPACATCHRAATGIDHSPYYMAQFSDAGILSTIETGVNSDDKYQTTSPHKMTFATAAAKAGIVPYLRSLDPNLLPAEQK